MDSLERFDPSLLLAVPLLPSAWYPVEEDAVVVIVDELERELALRALGVHLQFTYDVHNIQGAPSGRGRVFVDCYFDVAF